MRDAIHPRLDANIARGATDANGRARRAFAIVERERSRNDDGDDDGDADRVVGFLERVAPRERRRLRGHLRERRRGAQRAAAHDVVPQRRRVEVPREGHFESRVRLLVRDGGADQPRVRFRDGVATRRVADGEPSRYEPSRSVVARASNDGVRVGTLERERGDGGVAGTVRIANGGYRGEPTGRRRAERRLAVERRSAQRRLDVSIHIAKERHRERRATRHRARRRQKTDRARGGLGVPDGALDGAENERRGRRGRRGRRRGQRRRRRADLDGIAERGSRAVHLKRRHVRRHDRRRRVERARRTHRGANRRGLRGSVGRGERRTSTVLVRRRAGERDGDGFAVAGRVDRFPSTDTKRHARFRANVPVRGGVQGLTPSIRREHPRGGALERPRHVEREVHPAGDRAPRVVVRPVVHSERPFTRSARGDER